jgi:hypothetical protein
MERTDQPNADEVEEDVMNQLPTLNAEQLEELCNLVDLTVDAGVKGNKKTLRKILLKHLCTEDEDDNKMEAFLQIHSHMTLWEAEEDTAETAETGADANVKNEPVVVSETSTTVEQQAESEEKTEIKRNDNIRKPTPKATKPKGSTSITRREDRNAEIEISRVRLRDFKLPGTIGGEGENTMSFSTLEFEVNKAKKIGHSETEIAAQVITKVADKELKKLLQMEDELNLDEVMDMLRSANEEVRESRNAFREFNDATQKENEKVSTFVSRLQVLRKEVIKLGREEGVNYDEDMLKKQGYMILIQGLRDENIRWGLREKCKGDHNIPTPKLLKYVAEVVALEKERKKRLFGKVAPEIAINAIGDEAKEKKTMQKEKLNPFTKMDELQKNCDDLRTEMKAELNEIKSIVSNFNARNNEQQQDDGRRGRRRPYRKCANCTAENKNTCGHCWGCGASDHKKGDCPAGN